MEILLTILAVALLYVWVIIRHDTRSFVVRRVDVVSPKIDRELTVCVLADLHEKEFGNENRDLVEAVKQEKPDLVCCAGDLVTARRGQTEDAHDVPLRLMRSLSEDVPVYAASGNHETKLRTLPELYGTSYEGYVTELRKAGVRVLGDEAPFPLTDAVDLSAVDLDLSYFIRFRQKELTAEEMNGVCGTPRSGHFTILLAHEPSRFPVYAQWGADLVFSGHTHGGVARLFGRGVISPAFLPFPFYDGGAYVSGRGAEGPVVRHKDGRVIYLKEGERAMIQSRGLGTHTIHVRFRNPGELVVVRLHPERVENVEEVQTHGIGSEAAGL